MLLSKVFFYLGERSKSKILFCSTPMCLHSVILKKILTGYYNTSGALQFHSISCTFVSPHPTHLFICYGKMTPTYMIWELESFQDKIFKEWFYHFYSPSEAPWSSGDLNFVLQSPSLSRHPLDHSENYPRKLIHGVAEVRSDLMSYNNNRVMSHRPAYAQYSFKPTTCSTLSNQLGVILLKHCKSLYL